MTNARVVYGDSASMAELEQGEVSLVLTSPPYFDADTGRLLKLPVKRQLAMDDVQRSLIRFAQSLRPIFEESARVLNRNGILILQTKDIRYGGALLGLADVHRGILESIGLRLLTVFHWFDSAKERKRSGRAKKAIRVGDFKAIDSQQFMVFSRCAQQRNAAALEFPTQEISDWRTPLWSSPGPGARQVHPEQSPEEPLRRLIALYSVASDLVLDPFAGGGTVLRIARSLGRRAIGFEIDPSYCDIARQRLR